MRSVLEPQNSQNHRAVGVFVLYLFLGGDLGHDREKNQKKTKITSWELTYPSRNPVEDEMRDMLVRK